MRYYSGTKGESVELEQMHTAHLIAARNKLMARRSMEGIVGADEMIAAMNAELARRANLPNLAGGTHADPQR